MNNKESVEKGGHYFKYVIGVLFLSLVGSLISLALLDTFDYKNTELNETLGFNVLYALWGAWMVILSLYCWNVEPEEYPQHKETSWEARSRYVGGLCSFAFMALLYTIGSVAVLGMLLKWILEIDISAMGNAYRLIFLAWGAWIIGFYIWFKEQQKRKSK